MKKRWTDCGKLVAIYNSVSPHRSSSSRALSLLLSLPAFTALLYLLPDFSSIRFERFSFFLAYDY